MRFVLVGNVRLLLAVLVLAPPWAALAQEAPKVLRAGACAIDITPREFPVDVAGHMTPRRAVAAHDPLHARCLVLDNGDTKIAVAVCDSCMIPRKIFDRAKLLAQQATGIAADHMLCSATHTHSGVTVARAFQSEVETEYADYLAERIAAGIAQAHDQRQPARIGWAVGNNPRQVFNRRWRLRPGAELADPFDRGADRVKMNPVAGSEQLLKPAGPIDPDVTVVAFATLDGRPIAVLANYALHYVGGVPDNALSADYFGEFARQMARLTAAANDEPGFVAMMSNGASGDVNNINFFEGPVSRQPFEQIRLTAMDVAESAHAAYRRIQWRDWAPLAMREAELELGVRRPGEEEIRRAREILQTAGDGPHSDLRAVYAVETLDVAEFPPTVRLKLQAIRIGDLGVVSSPCETFVETGLAIKRESPLPLTMLIELANGYNGYLPTPAQHELGGYETWRAKSSYLAVDAEPAIRRRLLELLKDVSE